jgi:hypothetical protein
MIWNIISLGPWYSRDTVDELKRRRQLKNFLSSRHEEIIMDLKITILSRQKEKERGVCAPILLFAEITSGYINYLSSLPELAFKARDKRYYSHIV